MKDQEARKLVSSLSAKYVEKYAEPEAAPVKEKAGVLRYAAMAACLMLLIGLAAGNIALAGGDKEHKYRDGNAYKVVEYIFPEKDEDYNVSTLYYMGIKNMDQDPYFQHLMELVKEQQDFFASEELKEKESEFYDPDYLKEVDWSLAIPIFVFDGFIQRYPTFTVPVVENGRITEVVSLTKNPVNGKALIGVVKLGVESTARIMRGLESISALTTEKTPMYVVGTYTFSIDDDYHENNEKGLPESYFIIGETAYQAYDEPNPDLRLTPFFKERTVKIDWDLIKQYGWELELKSIELWK